MGIPGVTNVSGYSTTSSAMDLSKFTPETMNGGFTRESCGNLQLGGKLNGQEASVVRRDDGRLVVSVGAEDYVPLQAGEAKVLGQAIDRWLKTAPGLDKQDRRDVGEFREIVRTFETNPIQAPAAPDAEEMKARLGFDPSSQFSLQAPAPLQSMDASVETLQRLNERVNTLFPGND